MCSIYLSMILVKMYGLYCPCSKSFHKWHDVMCNGALHCICTGTSHLIGVSAWL